MLFEDKKSSKGRKYSIEFSLKNCHNVKFPFFLSQEFYFRRFLNHCGQ